MLLSLDGTVAKNGGESACMVALPEKAPLNQESGTPSEGVGGRLISPTLRLVRTVERTQCSGVETD